MDKNEMALGLGVHGEAGVKNVEIRSSKDTVDLMLNHMMDKNSSSHLDLNDKMAGFNITVLRLSEKLKKENLVSLLEMETDTPVVLASTKKMD
ncbi:hypothetical protein Avbf_09208 [Armadillidium vulgare]|nr:hypothetical protein Avbf_09208 [Armadillidium vulgare]